MTTTTPGLGCLWRWIVWLLGLAVVIWLYAMAF